MASHTNGNFYSMETKTFSQFEILFSDVYIQLFLNN